MFEVDNSLTSANIPRTIRFTENIFSELQELAFESNISFNLLVLQCCKYALIQNSKINQRRKQHEIHRDQNN